MTHIARIIQIGNSQAIKLPKELRLSVDRVEIIQEGDTLILRPHLGASTRWRSLKAALSRILDGDFFSDGREQLEHDARTNLDEIFCSLDAGLSPLASHFPPKGCS